LRFRRENAALFAEGSYTPVTTTGALADCVIAFERKLAGKKLLVVVPRFISRVGFPPLGERWQDTALASAPAGAWTDLFTWRQQTGAAPFQVAALLSEFPVAVLISEASQSS
jgi:maltooligosyltrehalose synthase